MRKLKPGASPSSSRGCCERHSISFPTCASLEEDEDEEEDKDLDETQRKEWETDLADSLQFGHPQKQLAKLARHVRVVSHSVVLRRVFN